MAINKFLLIIGAMKCGTTTLFDYLSQHPQIAPSRRKEPNFFTDNWDKGWEWYISRWESWNPDNHKIAMEATINYTKVPIYPNAAERIFSLKKKANFKFIYIVRDPIARIESHYTHARGANWGNHIYSLSKGIHPELIETSRYAAQIEEYYSRFPSEDILLLNFEDLKLDIKSVLRKICNFANLYEDFSFSEFEEPRNSNKSRVVDDYLWRTLRANGITRSIGHLLPKMTREKIHKFFGKQVNQNFRLSIKQRNLVLRELEEDLVKLRTKFHVDIGRWKNLPKEL